MKITHKLALGTVQFGLHYGITNRSGKTTESEVARILELAWNASIEVLDTARGYGDSENVLGSQVKHPFKIVTKFKPASITSELIDKDYNESTNALRVRNIYGFIAHDANQLLSFPDCWNALQYLKETGKVQKIGYSLYSVEQLEKLLDMGLIPDLVQLPFSLLDRKFEDWLPKLKTLGVEIHTRSVFLQGLYFMDVNLLNPRLKPLRSNLQELHKISEEIDVPIGAIALQYAISNISIDKVLVGVETSSQLEENISYLSCAINSEVFNKIHQIVTDNKELLNPATWQG